MEFDAVSAVISEMTCGLVIRSIDYDIRHLLLPHSKMKTVRKRKTNTASCHSYVESKIRHK